VRSRAAFHHYVLSPLVVAPLMAIAAVGNAMSSSLLAHMGLAADGLVQAGIAVGMGAALGYAGGRSAGHSAPSDRSYQRGTQIQDTPPAGKSRSSSRAITLAGIEVPQLDETKHFKLIGTTGTGKSTAIQEMLSTALKRGDRAVIADPDGGYMRHFYSADRGDVVMNPFDSRSVKWDLFGEIKSAYDVEQLAGR
jgi:hypothetical protein